MYACRSSSSSERMRKGTFSSGGARWLKSRSERRFFSPRSGPPGRSRARHSSGL
jgi:hypothetical protein